MNEPTCKKCGMKIDGSFRFPRAEIEYLNEACQVIHSHPAVCLDCLVELLKIVQKGVAGLSTALHPNASIMGVTIYFDRTETTNQKEPNES